MKPLIILILALALFIIINPLASSKQQHGGNSEQCLCENKFSTENLGKVLTGKIKTIKDRDSEQELEPEIDLVRGAQKRSISSPEMTVVKAVTKHSLCRALKKAGFNPNWTINDIQLLSMNPDGRNQLRDVDAKLKASGLTEVKHKDIAKCYPGYMKGYICKVGQGHIESEEQNAESVSEVPVRTETTDVTGAEAESPEGIMHCHWPSIENDIHQSVSEFYRTKSDDTDPEKLVMESSYTIQRAMLEIKNIINLFQSKSKAEFGEFLTSRKEQNITGLKLDGTKYHIPWYIFGKYNVCFGSL